MTTAVEITSIQYRILSAFVQQPKWYAQYAEKLQARFFTEPMFQELFKAMRTLYITYPSFDVYLLRDYFTKHPINFDTNWLDSMSAEAMEINTLEQDIETLRDYTVRHTFHTLGLNLLQKSADKNTNVTELKNLLYGCLHEVNESAPVSEINSFQNLINKWQQKGFVSNNLTWFDADLNELLNGLGEGELIIIGGRPGMGKTSFLHTQLVHLALTHQQPIGYINLLENYGSLTSKLGKTIQGFNVDEPEELPLYVCTNLTTQDIQEVIQTARTLVYKYQIKVLAIDCFQQISYQTKMFYRDYELGKVLQQLKQLGKELNICIIVTSQLSRAAERRSSTCYPALSDLKDTGHLEELADKVLLLYRYSYYGITEYEDGESTDEDMEVMVAKNNEGKTGKVTMVFDGPHLKVMSTDVSTKRKFHFPDERLFELE